MNAIKIHGEFLKAGLPILSAASDGTHTWSRQLTQPEIALVASIEAAHDPTDTVAARKKKAKGEAALAAELKNVTPAQAVTYIENNVTNLASAKAVMKIMARMLIAIRDDVFPELPEE